jgi:hypothetical protein
MSAFTTFFKLDSSDKKLLFETLYLLIKVKITFLTKSFSKIKESYLKLEVSEERELTVCKMSWALKAVSHYMPGTTCLINALAGYSLLARHGYQGLVKIGVSKSAEGEFEAHAWLEYKDRVIIGELEKEYVPLFDF